MESNLRSLHLHLPVTCQIRSVFISLPGPCSIENHNLGKIAAPFPKIRRNKHGTLISTGKEICATNRCEVDKNIPL